MTRIRAFELHPLYVYLYLLLYFLCIIACRYYLVRAASKWPKKTIEGCRWIEKRCAATTLPYPPFLRMYVLCFKIVFFFAVKRCVIVNDVH